MARKSVTPWTLRLPSRTRNYEFRISHQGVRYSESTSTSEFEEATKYAERRYAEIINGDGRVPTRLAAEAGVSINELGALWLADEHYDDGPRFVYVRSWNRHFGNLRALCATGAIAAYWRKRLGEVLAKTVRREFGPLVSFLQWCEEKKLVSVAPKVPPLPDPRRKGNRGTPHRRGRNSRGVWVTTAKAEEIIAALPEHSTGKAKSFPVRARFIVMLETSLRGKTLEQLSVPEHYRRGDDHLTITNEIDKNSFGRRLPLTPAARAALDLVCPKEGSIFGRHDYRPYVRAAAKQVLPEPEASHFTAYDFRRRALSTFGEVGSLTAIAYMAGHRQLTTSSLYVRPELSSAKRMLASLALIPSSLDANSANDDEGEGKREGEVVEELTRKSKSS